MTITEAMAELEKLKPEGDVNIKLEYWRYDTGKTWEASWNIWDGNTHFPGPTIAAAMANFRASLAPSIPAADTVTAAVKALEGQA